MHSADRPPSGEGFRRRRSVAKTMERRQQGCGVKVGRASDEQINLLYAICHVLYTPYAFTLDAVCVWDFYK